MTCNGRCLCGDVHYASEAKPVFVGHCYCVDCRRESGAGHITAVAVPDPTVTTTGEVRTFDKAADSGETIRNTFCPVCATTPYSHPSALPGLTLLRAGKLDDPAVVSPQVNLYVVQAPAWDRPAAGLTDFPGMARG